MGFSQGQVQGYHVSEQLLPEPFCPPLESRMIGRLSEVWHLVDLVSVSPPVATLWSQHKVRPGKHIELPWETQASASSCPQQQGWPVREFCISLVVGVP